jgi:hypothetical protein
MSVPHHRRKIYELKSRIWLAELEQTKVASNLKVLAIAIEEARLRVHDAEVWLEAYNKITPEGEALLNKAQAALDAIPKRTLK